MSERASRPSLEQRRAEDAWRIAAEAPARFDVHAKDVPVMIMNAGLLQTLAFLTEKGKKKDPRSSPHLMLRDGLLTWLVRRGHLDDHAFVPAMASLMAKSPAEFRAVTAEAIAWLRWVRHFAPALAALPQDETHD